MNSAPGRPEPPGPPGPPGSPGPPRSPALPPPERDPGLQPERTRLAWRRTTLACTVVAILGLRQALLAGASPLAVSAAAATVGVWLLFLVLAQRRIRRLATPQPPTLSLRMAVGATACTIALAVFAVAVVR